MSHALHKPTLITLRPDESVADRWVLALHQDETDSAGRGFTYLEYLTVIVPILSSLRASAQLLTNPDA